MATRGNNVTVWRPKYSVHWQASCAQCSFPFFFSVAYFTSSVVRGLGVLYFIVCFHLLWWCKNAQVSHNVRYFSWHREIMAYIILFEEDSLEVSFNAWTAVMTSLPNCCYEGAKKTHTRDQACPVLCMLVRLKTFSFYYIKCHKRQITAVTLNKTEENKTGGLCWYWK